MARGLTMGQKRAYNAQKGSKYKAVWLPTHGQKGPKKALFWAIMGRDGSLWGSADLLREPMGVKPREGGKSTCLARSAPFMANRPP